MRGRGGLAGTTGVGATPTESGAVCICPFLRGQLAIELNAFITRE
jgi:hypothetical protein